MGMIAHCTACRRKVIINGGGGTKKFLRSWTYGGRKRGRSDGLMAERRPNLCVYAASVPLYYGWEPVM